MGDRKGDMMKFLIKLILSILVIEVLGALGGLITANAIPDWYAGLEKPPGNPPNWLFGPVWATLYAFIGISFALVWHRAEPGPEKSRAMRWFWAQLVLNLIWTPVFFGLKQPLIGLAVILLLLFTIVMTIRRFRRLVPVTFWLLLPYLLWVSYATYLNTGLWWLNRL